MLRRFKSPVGLTMARPHSDALSVAFPRWARARHRPEVKDTVPNGFAAIKITGLCNPKLLERLSQLKLSVAEFFLRVSAAGRVDQAQGPRRARSLPPTNRLKVLPGRV